MSLLTDKLIREMFASQGVIIRHKGLDTWPIHPRGDRRKRPIAWIAASDARALLDDGVLAKTEKGLALSGQTCRRIRFGASGTEIETSQGFAPHGGLRPLRRNVRTTVVDRLSRRRDRHGHPLLSDPQIEAMHRFTRDYKRATGSIGSSGPDRARVDTSPRPDAAEHALACRIDASTDLKSAQAALGPDLASLVGKICGADERLEAIERAESWAKGSGLTVLKIGLDRLALHYGTIPGEAAHRKAG